MGNLLVSLRNAATAMRVFERGMSVVQSNVTNASTPGYARQTQLLEAMPFQPDAGLPGGVRAGAVADSRSEFAESSVRRRLSYSGESSERARLTTNVEPVLSIAADSGVSFSLNQLYSSFSSLTVAPNDTSARQVALDRAKGFADAVNSAAAGLTEADQGAAQALQDHVRQLNTIVSDIASLNKQFQTDFRAQQDSGLQARMSNALDSLAEVADVTVLRESDGSATLYLGGQHLLLVGGNQYPVDADVGTGVSRVVDAEGNDLTEMVHQGSIAAAVKFRNETLAGYRMQLDVFAKGVADTVNDTLAGGIDMNGQSPAQTLFRYDSALGEGRTLAVNQLAPQDLALASAAQPGGNAVALTLASLDQTRALGGFTFTQYYGNLAAQAGRDIADAKSDSFTNESLLAQVKDLRDQVQSVNLDEEAVKLLEFQRAYQASAQMIKTINEMTDTLLNLIR